MIYKTTTLNKIFESTKDLRLIADLVQARVCLSNTKPKMKNLSKAHKKYESFTTSIAKKHLISEDIINLCLEVEQYETCEDLQGVGVLPLEAAWEKLDIQLHAHLA